MKFSNRGIEPSANLRITHARGPKHTLKLKLEGGKLTGTIDGRSEINGKVKLFEWAIEDTELQGNDISFTLTHPTTYGSGPDSTTTYEGKVAGNTMTGSRNVMKRDFEANRVRE